MAMITDRISTGAFGDREHTAPEQPLWARIDAALLALVMSLQMWCDRVQQRRALLGLNDQELRDFAVTRADATRESDKPFWRR